MAFVAVFPYFHYSQGVASTSFFQRLISPPRYGFFIECVAASGAFVHGHRKYR
jgi:hypothetical protein